MHTDWIHYCLRTMHRSQVLLNRQLTDYICCFFYHSSKKMNVKERHNQVSCKMLIQRDFPKDSSSSNAKLKAPSS